MSEVLLPVYPPSTVAFTRGEGVWVWDTEGKQYLDATSGIGVCALGHSHPAVTETICQAARTLLHTSNSFRILAQEDLGARLTGLASMDKAFFCNSGAEANETAIKLARLYGHQKGIDHPEIIVMENSFHGRTLATLSASGSRKIQAGFEPLVTGFLRAPFNEITPIKTIAEHSKNVVAIMLEPILGNGGVIVPDANYLKQLRELCDARDWLLILDAVSYTHLTLPTKRIV